MLAHFPEPPGGDRRFIITLLHPISPLLWLSSLLIVDPEPLTATPDVERRRKCLRRQLCRAARHVLRECVGEDGNVRRDLANFSVGDVKVLNFAVGALEIS
jgi:hypothetical protein